MSCSIRTTVQLLLDISTREKKAATEKIHKSCGSAENRRFKDVPKEFTKIILMKWLEQMGQSIDSEGCYFEEDIKCFQDNSFSEIWNKFCNFFPDNKHV